MRGASANVRPPMPAPKCRPSAGWVASHSKVELPWTDRKALCPVRIESDGAVQAVWCEPEPM